jgi:ATP-dependent Lon protease
MDDLVYAIPTVALRGLVVFPGMVLHFDVARTKSIKAIETAVSTGQQVFLTCQKDPDVDDPDVTDLYLMGMLADIRQVINLPDGHNLRVVVEGDRRAEIRHLSHDDFLEADLCVTEAPEDQGAYDGYPAALVQKTRALFAQFNKLNATNAPPDVIHRVETEDKPGVLADYLASVLPLEYKAKQHILAEYDTTKRLELMNDALTEVIAVLQLQEEISNKVEKSMDDNQREYYLREQMRVISEELDGNEEQTELDDYRNKINAVKAFSDRDRKKLMKEVDRLAKMGNQAAAETAVIRTYLDTVLDLPWDTATEDSLDLTEARRILDEDHYGLDKVKDRIIELLAVRKLAPDITGQIICLAGPPGVGKTSIAQSLARAMGRNYARIALGGVHDEAEIRGHRKTYIGSMPGRIMAAMKDAGSNNPLILLDEIDKMASDMRGDPASAMLEVLDGEQNKTFADHYIEIPFDLSKVLFITTANDKSQIPAPLLDRMEVIDLYSYTEEEKFHIAKEHLVPKAIQKHGLTKKQMKITDAALHHIISQYTREAGVRLLERKINDLCRKCCMHVVEDPAYRMNVKIADLQDLLGSPRYKETHPGKDQVGVTNGLAWTSVGGELLQVEAAVMKGTGAVQLTGSLGDVMKESAKAAVSYLRTNADRLGVQEDFYKENDIHIHVPEGAVPKDGPSAGVTIATSLLSALTGKPVDSKVAMTGEISLTGRVMPIGGLREKTMAAYKAGMKTVIIPADNIPDLEEVDPEVKQHLEFLPVNALDQVWKRAVKGGINP